MGLRNVFEKRDVFSDSPSANWASTFPTFEASRTTFSGKKVSRRKAQSYIAVYACQSLIVDGIATMPVAHFRKLPDGRRESMPSAQSPSWVGRPNPYQTGVEFWTRVVSSLLVDGNAFLATIRDDTTGLVKFLYCLAPDSVEVLKGPGGDTTFKVGGVEYDRSQILHIPGFIQGDDLRGLSPLDIAREAVGLGLTTEEFGARFFNQGASMGGIIEHPGNPSGEEAKLLRDMFRKTHAGMKNSHAVGILTGGASFKPITMTAEQAQFLDTRKFQKAEIALLYRVPAYIVDPTVTSTWGAGVGEQNKFLVDYTFMPWAVRIEQAVSTFLLPGAQFIKFNFDARLRASTKDRYVAYGKAIDSGIMNVDEARALEDLPPLPGGQGQVFWRPANMVPIKEAIKGKPEPAPAPAPAEPAPVEGATKETGKTNG